MTPLLILLAILVAIVSLFFGFYFFGLILVILILILAFFISIFDWDDCQCFMDGCKRRLFNGQATVESFTLTSEQKKLLLEKKRKFRPIKR